MPTVTSDTRFLGIDLHSQWCELKQAWGDVFQSPMMSWLTPEIPVLLLQSDGGQSVWCDGVRQTGGDSRDQPLFKAVQLPEDLLLRRTQELPPMDDADVAHAAELQAQALSPFGSADLAWGYGVAKSAAGSMYIDIVMASRRQIAQYLQEQVPRLGGVTAVEVWAVQPDSAPVAFPGYAEGARRAVALKGRWTRGAMLACAMLLLIGVAVTPALQLRQRALDAYAAHQALARQVSPLVGQREILLHTLDGLQALAELQAARIEPLHLLAKLTDVLPDDTALQSFALKGQKATIAGLTANASALMQVLGQQEGLHDVRAPSAAVRSGVDGKENFTIEFSVDPRVFGVMQTEGKP